MSATHWDLQFFFRGMQNKETSASAWLATMLRHHPAFRGGFFELLPVNPSLDPVGDWNIEVETELAGPCDVTLESDAAFMFIEDKVAESAKTEGQLLRYYHGAAAGERAHKQLIGVYLGPSVATGAQERARVIEGQVFSERAALQRGDAMICLGWKDNLSDLVTATTEPSDWFARTGLAAILAHIAKVEAGRPSNAQRDALRRLLGDVAQRIRGASLAELGRECRFSRWAGVGEETLYTAGRPMTVMLSITFDEDDRAPYDLHDVVVGDRVRLRRVMVSINPSTRVGQRDLAMMSEWHRTTTSGTVDVAEIGRMDLVNDLSLQASREFDGTIAELTERLAGWGLAAARFADAFERVRA